MGKIKTREKVKDIKLLDKSAVVGQRMKGTFIRSRDRAAALTDDRQATPGEYAGDQVQTAADDMVHDTANVAVSGTKTAVRQGQKAFQQRRAKKAAERTPEGAPTADQPTPAGQPTTPPQTPHSTPEGQRPTNPEGRRPRQPTAPARQNQPVSVKAPGRAAYAADTPDPVVERGRQFAKQQAKKRTDTARALQRRAEQASRPAIKTRDALSPQRQAAAIPEHTASTARPPSAAVQRAAKSTGKATTETARGTVKTAGRTVKTARQAEKATIKTAEHTSKTAIKTAGNTVRAAQKSAQATEKAAQATARTARAAAKTAATAAKAAARAVASTVKAILAAAKALVTAIAAGGWVAVLAVIVICLIGLIAGSCFGIFFSGEDSGTGQTMPTAVREINQEYEDRLEEIKAANPYDVLEMSGSRALWPEVLSIYAVKTTNGPDGQDVASMDDEKKALLKEIFWAMHSISYHVETRTEGSGEDETTVTYLYITVTHKTAEEMADELRFTPDQRRQLAELLAEENRSLWSAVLYGIGAGDGEIVTVALSQIGNVGGEPYWSWYGFTGRVEWCACFVSWCANECGYLDMGVIPRFAVCDDGVAWFRDRGLWQSGSYEPRPGDIIFFDWDDENGQDGETDHVGIVEKVEDGTVYTVEGNSGDSCRERQYSVGYYEIYGYGTPVR